jgi:hypothetical protein
MLPLTDCLNLRQTGGFHPPLWCNACLEPLPMSSYPSHLLPVQTHLQEEAIRHWATTSAYRMDLARARSRNPAEVAVERERFTRALQVRG